MSAVGATDTTIQPGRGFQVLEWYCSGMSSPSSALVKVDRQGRLVLPLGFREELTTTPGEVVLTQTDDGVLISAVPSQGALSMGDDGLPVLRLGRIVSNDHVIAAVDAERGGR